MTKGRLTIQVSRIIIITIWLSIWVINTVQTTYGIETNTGLKHAEMYKAKAQSQNTTVATTNDNKKNTNLTDWLTAIGTISSAIGAVGIAGYSFSLTRRNEQRHSLEYVFRLLNDNAHRNARRTIYNLYDEKDRRRRKKILWVMGVKVKDLDRMEESAEIVKADFDEIGSLIENKSVPEKEFLKRYWLEVLKSWTVLRDEIKKIRQIDINYMENFDKLKCHAEEYRKRENLKQPEVFKDIIITPAVEDFKKYIPGPMDFKIAVFFDIPIDETTFTDKVEITNENTGEKIKPKLSWDKANNAPELTWSTGSDTGTSSYRIKIDKVQDTKGMQMEEAYSTFLPETRP